MVKFTRRLCCRKNHNGIGYLTLVTIGRTAAQCQTGCGTILRVTLTLGRKCRRTAAIQINSLHAAQRFHGCTNFCHGHADGIRCLATVYHQHYHCAICLNTNSRAGSTGGVVKAGTCMTVFKDIAEAGNSLHHIACIQCVLALLCAGDVRCTALINPESSAGRLVDHRAAHDKSATGTAVTHIIATGIDRTDNICTAAGLHAICLLGRRCHCPVSSGFYRFDVVITVANCNRSC